MKQPTHCERVLALLSDGHPHSHLELYALHVVAHSRVSDLRNQGHGIRSWRDGDLYLYQLTEAADGFQGSSAASVNGVDPDATAIKGPLGGGDRVDVDATPEAPVLHPLQLAFEVAA